VLHDDIVVCPAESDGREKRGEKLLPIKRNMLSSLLLASMELYSVPLQRLVRYKSALLARLVTVGILMLNVGEKKRTKKAIATSTIAIAIAIWI
jgi:hypothetical protein